MKTTKLKSELYTVDDFIEYYNGAGRRELKAALKAIGNTRDISVEQAFNEWLKNNL